MELKKAEKIYGEISVPGDKSISHRGIMLGAIAEGTTELNGFLDSADCNSTIACFREMGIEIEKDNDHVLIHGKGLYGLKEPRHTLDVGNSGTTTRLMSGILCGQDFVSHINGDASIQKRPMKRIITPLSLMGADISSDLDNGCAPLTVKPAELKAITYESPVASAQVKSAILLAGLYTGGVTRVIEPVLSRNHTELMLNGFGGICTSNGTTASVVGRPSLYGQRIMVPGDISSAAYFIAAATIVPNSELLIKNVNINETRAGILKVALEMGADISFENKRDVSGEPVADLVIRSSSLHGITIDKPYIPTLIDEIPVIAVMACVAEGQTIIKDAAELKVKESDRIEAVVSNLKAMGADIEACDDGMIINGGKQLHGAYIKTYDDHRIAMSFAIATLIADGQVILDNPFCVNISYPDFYDTLSSVVI